LISLKSWLVDIIQSNTFCVFGKRLSTGRSELANRGDQGPLCAKSGHHMDQSGHSGIIQQITSLRAA